MQNAGDGVRGLEHKDTETQSLLSLAAGSVVCLSVPVEAGHENA